MTPPFVAPVARDVVAVRGPDATSFLQSLVSQDLDAIAVGASAHSLLLQPQGKLVVDFFVHRVAADEWWCVCEGGFGEVLAAGLNRFKIRVKVEIESPAMSALAVRGHQEPIAVEGALWVAVEWAGAPAYDVVGKPDVVEVVRASLALPELNGEQYEEARIGAGVPRMGADLDERTIPQEAELERTAVSFTKGCFVGQELVCRIDTRGHVNRYLRRLRFSGDAAAIEPGADVVVEDRVVGQVTSRAGAVALAMVRREVEPGSEVGIAGAPGRARVEPLGEIFS
jgi:tRNA-modifying protein YgfZ